MIATFTLASLIPLAFAAAIIIGGGFIGHFIKR